MKTPPEYDLFVSYAHADNELTGAFDQYVWNFVKALTASLKAKMGLKDHESLEVYLDAAKLQANHPLEEILEAVKSSKLFLAFASPSYHNRKWTQEELEMFMSSNTDRKRVFVVELEPYKGQNLKEIEDRFVMRLYGPSSIPGGEPLRLRPDKDAYLELVNTLAAQMNGHLQSMKSSAATSGASASHAVDIRLGLSSLSRCVRHAMCSAPVMLAAIATCDRRCVGSICSSVHEA